MGGRNRVGQPTLGCVGAKPVGAEARVKRLAEPRGDGGALSRKWLSPVAKKSPYALKPGCPYRKPTLVGE